MIGAWSSNTISGLTVRLIKVACSGFITLGTFDIVGRDAVGQRWSNFEKSVRWTAMGAMMKGDDRVWSQFRGESVREDGGLAEADENRIVQNSKTELGSELDLRTIALDNKEKRPNSQINLVDIGAERSPSTWLARTTGDRTGLGSQSKRIHLKESTP